MTCHDVPILYLLQIEQSSYSQIFDCRAVSGLINILHTSCPCKERIGNSAGKCVCLLSPFSKTIQLSGHVLRKGMTVDFVGGGIKHWLDISTW